MAKESTYRKKYGATAMLLHWLMALLILAALVMGWYMADLPFSLIRVKLFNWHKWLGVSVLLFAIVRVFWRLRHPAPLLPDQMRNWEKTVAHATHWVMYALFLAVPLLGWTESSASGYPVVYLGLLPLPDLVAKNKALAETLEYAHAVCAYVLAALIVMHIAAAFKHALIDKDSVFSSMWPSSRVTPTEEHR